MRSSTWIWVALGLVLAGGAGAQTTKKYDPGITDTEILIGHSAPFSGPASAFGIYSRVEQAYFKAVNDRGGINGRKIRFIALDNGFNPPKALEASRRLVEEDGVFCEVGTVGTPTNSATQRYLNSKKVPQLLISAGGSKFNDPRQYPWTVPFYPSFDVEAGGYAKYILKTRPNAKIAILYQNDDYGKDYLNGFKRGLGQANLKMIVAEASYELTDATVDSQIINLAGSGADVFLNFTTPKFAAQAMRKANDLKWKPMQLVASPGSSVQAVLKVVGFENVVGVMTAQFFREPGDPAWAKDPAVNAYLDFMKKYAPGDSPLDAIGVSGYHNAQMVEHVLTRAGHELTRQNVVRQATTLKNVTLPMLLPGMTLNNTPDDYRAYHSFRLSRFDGKGWVEVETVKSD
ncbi:MAG: ABC transporter substrate-binding protein [Alphaproteobacteria bacterium]|nr:ABC transporter substrate-binding protein [Alphaproteobacteria bacterium]MCW5742163.1 ABC transporter substrate-binding protein [Alphaproteobacteria bacterium]